MSESLYPTTFAEINTVLNGFQVNIARLLKRNFLGMYVVGSLALGDFNPQHSDIDFIVVTHKDIGDDLFHGLKEMHTHFDASDSPWAAKVEAVYVPQDALRSDVQNNEQYPQIEKGTPLFKTVIESGWVFQCHTLREDGLVVSGPDPRMLLEPIDPEAMRPAVRAIAGLWLEQAQRDPDWLAWVRQRDAQAFVILTLCRMLYSLTTGDVVSKPAAARWAQVELGQPWTTLVASSLTRQHETGEISQRELNNTIAFVQYTFERS
jgi:hypothetical protein